MERVIFGRVENRSGSGSGSGYGYGYGSGDGSGDGYGYGYGSGYGDGDRSGDGYGYGYGYDKTYLAAVADGAVGDRAAELRKSGVVIAFWRSDKDGKPMNGGSGEPVTVGAVQEESGPLVPCRAGALHATMKPTAWKGERLWVVALYPPVEIVDEDKFAAKKREILAEIVPNFFN
jgi:hypothetical protein